LGEGVEDDLSWGKLVLKLWTLPPLLELLLALLQREGYRSCFIVTAGSFSFFARHEEHIGSRTAGWE